MAVREASAMEQLPKEELVKLIVDDKNQWDIPTVQKARTINLNFLSKYSSSFTSSFKAVGNEGTENCSHSAKMLEKKHFLLQVTFGLKKERVKQENQQAGVTINDHTGSFKCVLKASCNIEDTFDRTVLLMEWNFIHIQDCESYVEVQSYLPTKLSEKKAKHTQFALCVEDAFLAMKYREELKPGVVAVCGNVAAMSEMFRMKKDSMFLVKLGNLTGTHINILFKKSNHLHWHTFIRPQEEYVFTELRPTTVQKGTKFPTKLYVAWDHASFTLKSNWSGSLITLKEWLKVDHFPSRVISPSQAIAEDVSLKLFTYEGTITDVSNSHHAIYVLDQKIGLFMTYLPSYPDLHSLRLGTKLIVHNAHIKHYSQPPKTRLICCVLSCVKISEFSTTGLSPIMSSGKHKQFIKDLLGQYNCNLLTLYALVEFENRMKSKFGSLSSNQLMKDCLLAIMGKDTLICNKTKPLLQQFLPVPHSCTPFTQTDSVCIPDVINVGDITQGVTSLSSVLHKLQQIYNQSNLTPEQLQEFLYWNSIIDNQHTEGKVLLGVLKASKKTGQLQLLDNTGIIDVLISEGKRPEGGPRADNQLPGPSRGNNFFLSDYLNNIVCVTKYKLITEAYLATAYPSVYHVGDDQFVLRSRIHSYLYFTFSDMINLRGNDATYRCSKSGDGMICDKMISAPDKISYHSVTSTERNPDTNKLVFKMFFLADKESLLVDNRSNKNPNLRFCAVGSLISPSQNSRISQLSCQNEVHCTHISNFTGAENTHSESYISSQLLEKAKSQDCLSRISCSVKQPSMGTTTASNLTKSNGLRVYNEKTTTDIEPVLLIFQGSTVEHFHVLCPGSFYLISVPLLDKGFLEPKYISQTVQMAVNKFRARQCVVLPPSVQIKRLVEEPCQTLLSNPTICSLKALPDGRTFSMAKDIYVELLSSQEKCLSVNEVLNENCSSCLVNVKGKITRRTHPKPDVSSQIKQDLPSDNIQEINASLSISTLDNRNIEITLEDELGTGQLTVYLNLHRSSLPLGLLPGAWVNFSNLERRVSRKGTVYCQYIAVSTVNVIHLDDVSTRVTPPCYREMDTSNHHQSSDSKIEQKDFSFHFLGDLWRTEDEISNLYVVCSVSQILRLSLKCVCNKCGSEISTGQCSSLLCLHKGRHLLTKASVLVEDGSGSAIVSFRGDVLRDLLGLSPSQWFSVENKLSVSGELFIQQLGGRFSRTQSCHPLFSFFWTLCNSDLVKQQWKMYVKPLHSSELKLASRVNNQCLSEFPVKSVNTGNGSIDTHSLPFPQLLCVALEPVDMSAWVIQLMNLSESTAT